MIKTRLASPWYYLVLAVLFVSGIAVYWHIPKTTPAKLVDLRKDKLHNNYAIIVVERDASFYGHLFITTSDYSDPKPYPKTEGFGFYSTDNNVYQILHGNTTGGVLDDFDKKQMGNNVVKYTLVVWVDKEQYDACRIELTNFVKRSRKYKLFRNDCVSFVESFIKKWG